MSQTRILVLEQVNLDLQSGDFFMEWFVVFFHLNLDDFNRVNKSLNLSFGLAQPCAQLYNPLLQLSHQVLILSSRRRTNSRNRRRQRILEQLVLAFYFVFEQADFLSEHLVLLLQVADVSSGGGNSCLAVREAHHLLRVVITHKATRARDK